MSATRFVPLACPRCSGDLAGRAADRAAFCRPCGVALRCDGDATAPLALLRVLDLPPGDGPLTALPFWVDAGAAMPAFLTRRPLTLAQIATRLLGTWRCERGGAELVPFGARVPPEALGELRRFIAGATRPAHGAPALLGVPARHEQGRWRIPGAPVLLYPEDVLETAALAALAGETARREAAVGARIGE